MEEGHGAARVERVNSSDRSNRAIAAGALPKISVVTPSYNQGEFLERTIESVLSQSYPNLEYIVIDGGSEDNSVDIIRKYEHHLAYWFSEPDDGQSNAINKGLMRSTGEILAWLNSDDTYEPCALEIVGNYFREHPEIEVLYGDANLVDVEDRVLLRIHGVPYSRRALIYAGINLHQASTFWRRELFQRVGMLDEDLHFGMDYDLWFRFAKVGARFSYIPITFANFRQHAESKTVRATELSRQESRAAKEKYFNVRRYSYSYLFWHQVYRARKTWYYLRRGDISYIRSRLIKLFSSKD
jgi:glycosyltransferase involved in cell wall biosynthesis